ncbi:MAG: hypothetical protein NWR72_04655 [Bacteroidia bacterium]|nr:hypothetical protein [Bacteroidia bacterium]
MGCGSCGSGGCSSKGCGQNGGCATGGCNKLNTYDWLNNMLPPDRSEVDNIYEVRFKGTRKAFYRNVNGLRLYIGDHVVVESDRGYDIGTLSLGGVLAELQMRKRNVKKDAKDQPRIYRKANETDLELQQQARARDHETLNLAREIVLNLKLDMKVSDVEYQADNTKAIFYYIADHRVDFRELIKEFARQFRIRVEMRQIGLRHEAGLLGGIGSCGRELCCSTWLTDFQTVSTSAARYQNLSLNPMKISGLCGRLKCCLNFELDAYLDALDGFPEVNSIDTKKGRAFVQKTDIFKGTMWFSFQGETTWYPLHIDAVKEIISLNKKGEKPEVFTDGAQLQFSGVPDTAKDTSMDFVDGVGTTILKEDPRRGSSGSRRGGKSGNRGKGDRSGNSGAAGNQGSAESRNRGERSPRGNRPPQNQSNSPQNSGEKDPNGPSESRNRGERNPRGNRPPKSAPNSPQASAENAPKEPGADPRSRGGNRNNRNQNRRRPPAQNDGEAAQGPRPEPTQGASQAPRAQGENRPPRNNNRNNKRRPNNRRGGPSSSQPKGPETT